ncbi:MAG TPA: RDD family protein, partial [Nevskiaceae bacterium]|nr:RDD family protein [Nevskiaceae bacterium]
LPAAYSTSNPTGAVNGAAGHWARIGAALLDSMICTGLFMFVMMVLGFYMGTQGAKAKPPSGESIAMIYAVLIGAQIAYFTITQGGSKMASLGKRATDLIVVTTRGEPIGYGRALARYLVLFFTGFLFSLPLLVILFTRKHQGLHDLICGTVVIDKRTFDRSRWDYEAVAGSPNSSSGAVIAVVLLFFFIFMIGILAAIAIPAYQDYLMRAKVSEALLKTSDVKERYAAYVKEHQAWPASIDDLKAPSSLRLAGNGEVAFEIADGHALMLTLHGDPALDGKRIELVPIGTEGAFEWKCRVVDLPPKFAPSACR